MYDAFGNYLGDNVSIGTSSYTLKKYDEVNYGYYNGTKNTNYRAIRYLITSENLRQFYSFNVGANGTGWIPVLEDENGNKISSTSGTGYHYCEASGLKTAVIVFDNNARYLVVMTKVGSVTAENHDVVSPEGGNIAPFKIGLPAGGYNADGRYKYIRMIANHSYVFPVGSSGSVFDATGKEVATIGTTSAEYGIGYANTNGIYRCMEDGEIASISNAQSGTPAELSERAFFFLGDSFGTYYAGHSRIPQGIVDNGFACYSCSVGGAQAKNMSLILTGYGVNDGDHTFSYNQNWENLFEDGKCTDLVVLLGMNAPVDDKETDISKVIPANVVGELKDIINGRSITVDGATISTVADYYSKFATNHLGAMAWITEWVNAKYPEVNIWYCNYNMISGAKYYNSTYADLAAQALSAYYGFPVIDILRNCGINQRNYASYTQDKTHLNEAGSARFAKTFSECVRRHEG